MWYNEVMVNKKTVRGNKNFREVFCEYITKGVKLERWQWVGVMLLIWVVSGMVGWVYEFFVALFDKGEIYMVGGNLLPWINIYAFGAMVLVPATYKLRKYPWAVFLVAVVVTGVVELVGGWLVYVVGDGTRYWNYGHGLWAVCSIDGFVCLLSVVLFGIGALALMYFILPMGIYLAKKMTKRGFLALSVTLFTLVMVDEIGNLILKNLGEPTAMDLYQSLGMKYQKF